MLRFTMMAVALCLATFAALAPSASAKPPLEAFGDVPAVWSPDISPDGKKVAFINRIDGADYLSIYDFDTRKTTPLASVTELKAQYISFVGNNYVVAVASKTTRTFGYTGRYELSAAFALNLTTRKFVQLLSKTEGLYPAQGGVGSIFAVDPDGEHVYMPAYSNSADDPPKDMYKVSLETGRGEKVSKASGVGATIDWIVAPNGSPIAREDFSKKKKEHSVRAWDGGPGREIYSQKSDMPTMSLTGVSAKGDKLILIDERDGDFSALYEMSVRDGAITGPLFARDNADVVGVVLDENRVAHGVRYSGMYPSYEMFDPDLNADMKIVAQSFKGSAVYLDSWSADWSKLLFVVDGGARPSRYVLFNRPAQKLSILFEARPEIKPEHVGEVITIEYKARDGLKIPGIITWPAGVPAEQRKNLPFVVLPHGGPASYDSVGFDWMAQFLANEGYGVLQPNFRGSAGFGSEFQNAGAGQWGRKMQDDITDGVKAVVGMGWADPNRMCIVGASYGGYAALAGGALTPDLYKCVVSIAGVSNLREMLVKERAEQQANSSSYAYWRMQIGDPDRDRDAIEAVSPVKLTEKFVAPVLLVHGADDLTVPATQSNQMESALKSRKKEVSYVRIKGDDHYFTANESRRMLLTTMGEFLKKHIGAPQ